MDKLERRDMRMGVYTELKAPLMSMKTAERIFFVIKWLVYFSCPEKKAVPYTKASAETKKVIRNEFVFFFINQSRRVFYIYSTCLQST